MASSESANEASANKESANEQHRVDLKSSEDETRRIEAQSQRKAKGGGCVKAMKYIFFLMNFIIFLAGIIVFLVGLWAIEETGYEIFLKSTVCDVSGCLLVVSGVITVTISLLANFPLFRKTRGLRISYIICLLTMFVVMLIGGLFVLILKCHIGKDVYEEMIRSIPLYKNNSKITIAWQTIQRSIKCCGVITGTYTAGWLAWGGLNPNVFGDDVKVPSSCCRKVQDTKEIEACQREPTKENAYLEDCYEKLKYILVTDSNIIGKTSIGLSFVLVVGVVVTYMYSRNMELPKEDKEDSKEEDEIDSFIG